MTRYFWLGILFSSFLFAQTQVELSKQAKGVLAPGKGGTGLSSCPESEGLTWESGALVCSALASKTHAATHQNGGADEVATSTPAANAIPKADASGILDDGWIPSAISRDSETPSGGDLSGSLTTGYTLNTSVVGPPEIDLAGSYPWTGTHTFTDLQDKGGQVFNVKAYGAAGDGVTNDITALNSAVTAANAVDGAIIYFPPGTYALATSWVFNARENITVIGSQATLRATNGSNLNQLILVSNGSKHIVFDGLRLDGNFINQSAGLGRGIAVSDSLDIQVLNSHIFNFNIAGSQSFAFFCFRSPYCVVRGNLFYNNGAADIRMASDLADGTRDFLLDDTDTAKSFSDNCVITNNRFGIFPFSEFSTATDWDRKNASRGAVQMISTRGCVVSNNVIYSPSRDAATDVRGHAI